MPLHPVIGSLRILHRRSAEVGQPGLGLWAEAGEQAALAVSTKITALAHANESEEVELERELAAILADGQVSRAECRRLRAMLPRLKRLEDRDHDITEEVRP